MPNGNIMIVDDVLVNLKLLISVLEGAGYTVRPSKSGALALKAARLSPPDLLMLDIQMPEMDGYAVCAAFQAERSLRDVPIFFITALGEQADYDRAQACGVVEIIGKPFQIEEILTKIAHHLPG